MVQIWPVRGSAMTAVIAVATSSGRVRGTPCPIREARIPLIAGVSTKAGQSALMRMSWAARGRGGRAYEADESVFAAGVEDVR
jgi:hypothetical protein